MLAIALCRHQVPGGTPGAVAILQCAPTSLSAEGPTLASTVSEP